MQVVTLLPLTKRLKQLIAEHGAQWCVLERGEHLPCFGGEPGLFIQSVDAKHTRWVMTGWVQQ